MPVYRFDRFELSGETEELRKRGVAVRLSPQPFRLLLLLVSRAGTVVTREEIREELWGEATFVEFEQSINAAIRRIRFALNDQAETPRFLRTLPRRGYLFFAPVERVEADEPVSADPPIPEQAEELAPRRRWWAIPVAAAFAIVVALLFFALRSAPPSPPTVPTPKVLRVHVDHRALAAELQKRLAPLSPERIVLVSSDAACDLRVRAEDGSHLDVRLTDAASGLEVWSRSFPRTKGSGGVPLEASVLLSRAIVERCAPLTRDRSRMRSGVSPRALELYRQGIAIRNRPVPERNLDRAVELFDEALGVEPRFAEAWSAIGDVWTERTTLWMGESRRTAMTQARLALDRALALDPNEADALNARGVLLMRFERNYPDAEAAMRKAVASDPSYVEAHCNLAMLLSAMGRHDEAIDAVRRAQKLDPATHVPSPILAYLLLMARRFPEASAEYRASLAAFPNHGGARWGMMFSSAAEGRWDEAAAAISALHRELVENPPAARDSRAAFHAHLRQIEPKLLARERASQLDPYLLACFYSELGEIELAFAALDRAMAAESLNAIFAFVDPRLDPLRRDPRFRDRLGQMGFTR
jgi:DNA-binding winged helix-turn-helix (wHTH) protein/tetratricopeptide (TPR) repeat protein